MIIRNSLDDLPILLKTAPRPHRPLVPTKAGISGGLQAKARQPASQMTIPYFRVKNVGFVQFLTVANR